MSWVILCTVVAYVVVNLPLVYSLFFVHGRKGISSLWGYAPNQFLFLILPFPFAAFMTFMALRILIGRLGPSLPPEYSFKGVYDHWLVSLLIGLAITCIITSVVYFTSAMSFDKLEPKYAIRAIQSVRLVEDQLLNVKSDEREDYREKLIMSAKEEIQKLSLPPLQDSTALEDWLNRLRPEVFLQVVQNPGWQLRLKIMNPTIHALNIVQLLTALFIASCGFMAALLCIHGFRVLNLAEPFALELRNASNALFYALFFFAFYPICYRQHREEIENFIGPGSTILQDVFAGILVIAVMIWLRSSDPNNRELSLSMIGRYIPVGIAGTGLLAEIISPQIMRQLIGSQTNLGIQIIFGILFVVFSLLPVMQVWLRD